MKKIVPLAFAIMGVFAVNAITLSKANAAPSTSTEGSTVEKKPVKKKAVKKRKKKVVVKQPTVAELKTQCYNQYTMGADVSAAAFFACDNIGNPSSTFEPRTKKSEFTFFKAPSAQKTIDEATKLQGLHARTNREEIKTYLKAGNNNNVPVDPVKTPWCAAFANAVLRRTGYEGTDSLMARSFLSYGLKTKDPQEGDIVVLKRGKGNVTGHVGFFNGYEWEGNQLYVKVLGGNQNKSITVAYFPVNYVLDYRRPV